MSGKGIPLSSPLCLMEQDVIRPFTEFYGFRGFLQTVSETIEPVVFEPADVHVLHLYSILTNSMWVPTIVYDFDHGNSLSVVSRGFS